jgi:hypothetical protein
VGSADWRRQRPVRVRVQGPRRGARPAGEAIQGPRGRGPAKCIVPARSFWGCAPCRNALRPRPRTQQAVLGLFTLWTRWVNGRWRGMADAVAPVDLASLAAARGHPGARWRLDGEDCMPTWSGSTRAIASRPTATTSSRCGDGQSDRGRRRAACLPVDPLPPIGGPSGGWARPATLRSQQTTGHGGPAGLPIRPLELDGGRDTIQLRETSGDLSGLGSETHQHFSPADATCCCRCSLIQTLRSALTCINGFSCWSPDEENSPRISLPWMCSAD